MHIWFKRVWGSRGSPGWYWMCIALYPRCLISSAEESLFRFSPSKMCQTLRTKNSEHIVFTPLPANVISSILVYLAFIELEICTFEHRIKPSHMWHAALFQPSSDWAVLRTKIRFRFYMGKLLVNVSVCGYHTVSFIYDRYSKGC